MRKATANTLTNLLDAMSTGRMVTIRYVKPTGEVSRRKIEIHAIEVSGEGNILVKCYDHRSDGVHTFRLDRITHYTLHRIFGHTVPTSSVADQVIPGTNPMTLEPDTAGFRAWDFTYKLTA